VPRLKSGSKNGRIGLPRNMSIGGAVTGTLSLTLPLPNGERTSPFHLYEVLLHVCHSEALRPKNLR